MSKYLELRAVDVSDKVEKKNNLSYLSWAWAVDTLLQHDPAATWSYSEPSKFGETMMVFCTVNAFGKHMTAQLPVMDYRNKAIPNPDAFAVNTAMQRCLAKAIALHGLGLSLYVGEDLWDDLEEVNFDSYIVDIRACKDAVSLKELFAKQYTVLQKNKVLRDKLTEVYQQQKEKLNAPIGQPA